MGFKWFAPGLFDGSMCFGGEESAGASFLRRDGTVWATDKDGLIMALLAAEITARTGRDPGVHYQALEAAVRHAALHEDRRAGRRPSRRPGCRSCRPRRSPRRRWPASRSLTRMTRAPGNDEPIGGLKVVAPSGWFAARPSGTENVYKIYAESFRSDAHLEDIVTEAQQIVDAALGGLSSSPSAPLVGTPKGCPTTGSPPAGPPGVVPCERRGHAEARVAKLRGAGSRRPRSA